MEAMEEVLTGTATTLFVPATTGLSCIYATLGVYPLGLDMDEFPRRLSPACLLERLLPEPMQRRMREGGFFTCHWKHQIHGHNTSLGVGNYFQPEAQSDELSG